MKRGISERRLLRMRIEDFGLIARAELGFVEGLTVCSGETGSGKTMLLGSLSFALGARASSDAVRSGASRARVTLEVRPDQALREVLAAQGFETEDEEDVIFWRELSAAGKSSARINGRPATGAQLRALGERIVDFVGQHEQQRLLSAAYQLEALDRFAGEAAGALRESVAASYRDAAALAAELRTLEESAARSFAEYERAKFVVEEIDDVALRLGEQAELRERREFLSNVERIGVALRCAHEALGGEEASAIERLGGAATALAQVAAFDEALRSLHLAVSALQSEAREASLALMRELDRLEADPEELETIAARLDRIERLERKYGGSIEAVLVERERAAALIETFASRDERLVALRAELDAARERLAAQAKDLTALRARAATALEERVAKELRALAMPAARVRVLLEPLEEIGSDGAERAAFLLAPNPGEPPRSLAKAASGGELSRVLLALILVAADHRDPAALVFDEIDAGIGGATAKAVGARLGALACTNQVLCVTHLAQIASWADAHYVLQKQASGDATRIELRELREAPAVREEIARMLSGTLAPQALEHADLMLREVGREKKE